MAKYIFYTDEGTTTAPNGDDVENLQVIGIEDGKSQKEATKNLLKNNRLIKEMEFDEDRFRCFVVLKPEVIHDLEKILEYLWEDEEKHFEECEFNDEDADSHIFNALKNIKENINWKLKKIPTQNK